MLSKKEEITLFVKIPIEVFWALCLGIVLLAAACLGIFLSRHLMILKKGWLYRDGRKWKEAKREIAWVDDASPYGVYPPSWRHQGKWYGYGVSSAPMCRFEFKMFIRPSRKVLRPGERRVFLCTPEEAIRRIKYAMSSWALSINAYEAPKSGSIEKALGSLYCELAKMLETDGYEFSELLCSISGYFIGNVERKFPGDE
ncbi:hypothetical protein IKF73_00160 [Candidatus Saccharibacteria bacterium]|nr:hypothetical protein [Candidatus Saccharibacteria bacterium]